jgi:hypothetical protein
METAGPVRTRGSAPAGSEGVWLRVRVCAPKAHALTGVVARGEARDVARARRADGAEVCAERVREYPEYHRVPPREYSEYPMCCEYSCHTVIGRAE